MASFAAVFMADSFADPASSHHPISEGPTAAIPSGSNASLDLFRSFSPYPMRKFLVMAAKTVLIVLSLAIVGLLAFVGWLVWHYQHSVGLPTKTQLAAIAPTGPACSTDPKRTYIPLADVPPLLRGTAIALAQPDFYEAWSLNSVIEIAVAMSRGSRPRPAGVTQSVSRCLQSLSPETRRQIDPIASIIFIQRVIDSLSRDRIFEIYLNESYLGRGAYGVASAAETYFGKSLPDLEIDEIAFLMMRARQPGPSRYFDTDSRNYIIDRMQTAGLISATQAGAAKSRPLPVNDRPGAQAQPVNQ